MTKISEVCNYKLHSYQMEGVKFHLSHKYSINGFTMGLGKTVTSLTVAYLKSRKCVVAVPAYLIDDWEEEIAASSKIKKRVVRIKGPITQKQYDNHDFFLVSYNSVAKLFALKDAKFDMMIIDECQYIKNPKALRTRTIHTFVTEYKPKYVLALSGTPIANKVPEWWANLLLCWYGGEYPEFTKYSRSQFTFAEKFCNREYVFMKKFIHVGVRNREMLRDLVRKVYIRKRSSEVLDLPEMNNKVIKLSKKNPMEAELIEAWEGYCTSNSEAPYASLKAKHALYMVPYTVEHVRAIIDNGLQCVVFTAHTESANALVEGLKDARAITGKVPISRRKKIRDDFKAGKFKVLVGTEAISTGYNFTNCSYMVFNDLPWTPITFQQVRKRIHRIGQTKRCFYHYLLAFEISFQIYQKLLSKVQVMDEAINV